MSDGLTCDCQTHQQHQWRKLAVALKRLASAVTGWLADQFLQLALYFQRLSMAASG